MALEQEIKTYNDKLPELVKHEGKHVLVQGDDIVGLYDSYEDAINDGYARFNLTPFLVKQIRTIEQVHFLMRVPRPCHTSLDR